MFRDDGLGLVGGSVSGSVNYAKVVGLEGGVLECGAQTLLFTIYVRISPHHRAEDKIISPTFKITYLRTMDINLFRTDHGGRPAVLKESQRRRGGDVQAVDDVIALDAKWREAQHKLDSIKADAGRIGKLISERKKKREDISDLVKQVYARQPEIEVMEKEALDLLRRRDARLHAVGSVLHPSVPVGGPTLAKTIIRLSHSPETAAAASLSLLEYSDLLKRFNAHDGEHAGLLKGVCVLLQQALLSFTANFLVQQHCTLVSSPLLVPQQIAHLLAEDPARLQSLLVGTIPMCLTSGDETLFGLHAGQWLEEGSLPLKYATLVTCLPETPYRGYYGQDQSEAAKLLWLVDPEDSFAALDALVGTCEEFYRQLSLRYRVVLVSSSSMSRAAAKEVPSYIRQYLIAGQYEIECLLPGTQHHRPLARVSNLTDYRSRQLGIRYGPKKQGDLEKRFAHLISATLFFLPPLLCTLLEQTQTERGIKLPEILRPLFPAEISFSRK